MNVDLFAQQIDDIHWRLAELYQGAISLLLLLKQEIGQPVPQGTRMSVRFTDQDFAEACSTTRVTITRLLGQLQQQGRITLDSQNHIILRDQEQLS